MRLCSLLIIFTILFGCGTPFTIRHFRTEGKPENEVAVITVSDKIKIHAIDGEDIFFGSVGGDYKLHVAEGRHTFLVSYYDTMKYYGGESVGKITIKRAFLKNRHYYLGTRPKGATAVEFYFIAYASPGTFVEGIQPLPELEKNFWGKEEMKTSKNIYPADEPITVLFKNFPGNKKDWITIVHVGSPADTWGIFHYLRGETQGSTMFTGKSPGLYEVRAYYNWPDGKFEIRHRYRFSVR